MKQPGPVSCPRTRASRTPRRYQDLSFSSDPQRYLDFTGEVGPSCAASSCPTGYPLSRVRQIGFRPIAFDSSRVSKINKMSDCFLLAQRSNPGFSRRSSEDLAASHPLAPASCRDARLREEYCECVEGLSRGGMALAMTESAVRADDRYLPPQRGLG